MIRTALGKAAGFFASARLATLLIAFVGGWSMLASFVPQGAVSTPAVAAWASAHPLAESLVRMVGLHQAYGAPLFSLGVVVLAVSTAVCAWRRTRAAVSRGRALRAALAIDEQALATNHDLEIPYGPVLGEAEVLAIAADALGRLGIRAKPRGATISAVSASWTVWGSPLFHWALLALIVTMPFGNLLRSSGQMGVTIGQQKADEPASYRIFSEGPLHHLFGAQRAIRVDAFELNFRTGGVDRGPTPTVSVLDTRGEVVKTQRVYPNNTLSTGSLTIYPVDYGLAATVALVDPSGVEKGRTVQLVDFSEEASGGTSPVGYLTVGDGGESTLRLYVSVPLDRVKGGLAARLPAQLTARVLVTSLDNTHVLDRVLQPGEDLVLPVGGALRLIDVGYYARLQLVDDPSIPMLYVGLTVAMIGLGIATLARQQIVTAAVIDTPDGARLAVRMRLWRNVTTSRTEIEQELVRALGGTEEGDAA